MIRKPGVHHLHAIGSASGVVCNDGIQRPTELVCGPSGLQDKPVAVDQQAKLVGPRVVNTVEPNVEITSNVDRLLVCGNSVKVAVSSSKNFCCTAAEPGRYSTTTIAEDRPTVARTQTDSNVVG